VTENQPASGWHAKKALNMWGVYRLACGERQCGDLAPAFCLEKWQINITPLFLPFTFWSGGTRTSAFTRQRAPFYPARSPQASPPRLHLPPLYCQRAATTGGDAASAAHAHAASHLRYGALPRIWRYCGDHFILQKRHTDGRYLSKPRVLSHLTHVYLNMVWEEEGGSWVAFSGWKLYPHALPGEKPYCTLCPLCSGPSGRRACETMPFGLPQPSCATFLVFIWRSVHNLLWYSRSMKWKKERGRRKDVERRGGGKKEKKEGRKKKASVLM